MLILTIQELARTAINRDGNDDEYQRKAHDNPIEGSYGSNSFPKTIGCN